MSRAKKRKNHERLRRRASFKQFIDSRIAKSPSSLQTGGAFERMLRAQQEDNVFVAG
jgi:hypothetical protein